MITRERVRAEFDLDKVREGDIVSYRVVLAHPFKTKYVRRHGIITSVTRDELRVTGTDDIGAITDYIFRPENIETREITVIIPNDTKEGR